MDLTPDELRQTTFRGSLRGYKVEDVDAFVERVALGVAALLDQMRSASERAAAAEAQAEDLRRLLESSGCPPEGGTP